LGYQETSAKREWSKVLKEYKNSHSKPKPIAEKSGMGLYIGLRKEGWEGIYFNPDTKNPSDQMDYHKDNYQEAKKWRYYGQKIHDLLVDYGPTKYYEEEDPNDPDQIIQVDIPKDQQTPKAKNADAKLAALKKIPFGIVILKFGQHTALLRRGRIYEVHWDIGPNDTLYLHSSAFIGNTDLRNFSGKISTQPGSTDFEVKAKTKTWTIPEDMVGRVTYTEELYTATKLEEYDWRCGLIVVPRGSWPYGKKRK